MNWSLATYKRNGENKENDWLLQYTIIFFLDSFKDFRGEFKDHVMSISQPSMGRFIVLH